MFKIAQKGYINFLVLFLLIIGISLGVYLVKKPTNIFPKAYDTINNLSDDLENVNVSANGRFGVVIDIRLSTLVPNANQFTTLQPGWVRFVYQPQYKIPAFPKGVKSLVVFGYDSVLGKPEEKELLQWKDNKGNDVYTEEALSKWQAYTNKYLAALEDFLKEYSDRVDAIEIWNEEDLCIFDYKINTEYFCPKVPEPVFANMLKKAAATIKQSNPNIKVVMGGWPQVTFSGEIKDI